MTKAFINGIVALTVAFALMLPTAALAGTLEDFVSNMSLEAKADPSGFKASLRTQFRVGGATVDLALSNVHDPADAYMILKVAEVSAQPVDKVINVFKANRNKGWGYIAKQMGIKPGSAEFHALKGGPSGTKAKGKSKGKKRK